MSDLRITSSGKIFYKTDSQLAAILSEALPGSFELVQPPPPALPIPRFVVEYNHGLLIRKPCIVFRYGASMQVWQVSGDAFGKPEAIEHEVRSYKPSGHVVPEQIIKQYLAANATYELGG